MANINHVLISNDNILIIDSLNKLWIMGNNEYRRTGVGESHDHVVYMPAYTGIQLDSDENIKKFHVHDSLITIFTTHGRLFIGNHQYTPDSMLKFIGETYDNFFYGSRHRNHTITNSSSRIPEPGSFIAAFPNQMPGSESFFATFPSNQMPEPNFLMLDRIDMEIDNVLESKNDSDEYDDPHDHSDSDDDDLDGEKSDSSSDNDHIIEQDSIADNLCTFRKAIRMRNKFNVEKIPSGFSLLESSVDQIMALYDTIFFLKGGSLYMYDIEHDPVNSIISKQLGLSRILHKAGFYYYYQLILPFDITNIKFFDTFVYIFSNNYHHILTVSDKLTDSANYNVVWLYFKTDIQFDISDIHYCSDETCVYIQHDNKIYKYNHATHKLIVIKKTIDPKYKTYIIKTPDRVACQIVSISAEDIYEDSFKSTLKLQHPLLQNFVDIDDVDFRYPGSYIIFIKLDDYKRLETYDNILFFNISGLSHYYSYNSGIIYCDSETIFYLRTKKIKKNRDDITELNVIPTSNSRYYLYMFTKTPSPISNVQFTNTMILLESSGKFYYYAISSKSDFKVNKFTEIIYKSKSDDMPTELVMKHLVEHTKLDYESVVRITIDLSSNKFAKMLSLMELIHPDTDLDIEFVKKNKQISFGEGPKREFMETAVVQFAEKFLIKHNVLTTFRVEAFDTLSKYDLINIGKMLHTVICQSTNPLPIRLPLVLLMALKKRPMKLSELEYFAEKENPELFCIAKKNSTNFESLDSGYDTYKAYLKHLCKYDHNDKLANIRKQIACGFIYRRHISDINRINYPTLDYYLSGDYMINS